jgi:hypothetical protein
MPGCATVRGKPLRFEIPAFGSKGVRAALEMFDKAFSGFE